MSSSSLLCSNVVRKPLAFSLSGGGGGNSAAHSGSRLQAGRLPTADKLYDDQSFSTPPLINRKNVKWEKSVLKNICKHEL